MEILEGGMGVCSDYVYLLVKELVRKDYDWRAVSINSNYLEAVHVVIEVNIDGKWYTFDPTYGSYYPYSVEEMRTLDDFQTLDPDDLKTTYLNYNVLNNISFISYFYDDTFFEIPKKVNYKVGDNNFISCPGYGLDQVFDNNTYTFFHSMMIYRLKTILLLI